MTPVRFWVEVSRSSDFAHRPGVDTGWRRDIEVAFLPAPGDAVVLGVDEEDGDPWCSSEWPVWRRVWSAEGVVEVTLATIQVDPSPDAVRMIAAWCRQPGPPCRMPWWTGADGDPEDVLRSGGWIRTSPPAPPSGGERSDTHE